MTDKIQKIKDWISKTQDGLMDANGNFENPSNEGAFHILSNLDYYIDSLQEEPVKRTPADIEAAMQEVEEKSRVFTEAHKGEDADIILAQMRGEEPVSEELEEAADKYESEQQEKYKDRDNHDFDNYRDGFVDGLTHTYEAFMSGAKWRKGHLWKPADGDDLPEIDREVIALTQPYPNDEHLRVVFAHRPNKYAKVWNSDLGEEQVVEIERHGKGEWNIPNVKYWLDAKLPYEESKTNNN